jgi:hypothetical protein
MMIATCLGVVRSSPEDTDGSLDGELSDGELWDEERGETITGGSQ